MRTVGSLLAKIGGLLGVESPSQGRMLGGFVDSLIQMFENCRPGLSDEMLAKGGDGVSAFFTDLYEKERPRLLETIRAQEQHLTEQARQELFERVDERIRKVVLPAYVRLASRFTPRERNDFYLLDEGLHGLERFGWGLAGMALGAFAVWAPFVPVWEKEWITPFALAGLFLPNLRRLLALRRYQSDLNTLVARTDNEIWRMDLAYLTDDMAEKAAGRTASADAETSRLEARLRATRPADQQEDAPRRRVKEGGR